MYGGPLEKYSEVRIYLSVPHTEGRNAFWRQDLLKTKGEFKLHLLIINSIESDLKVRHFLDRLIST